eukprot:Plantae.Rhodophyta-Rhodochaete_pulchella.ctg73205.p1 GENE.Plantae.Rhodophyta-Rhodochaete_pulchella.ctg73205~~Plantae.Rhodophyta-Rhodochaete_pulchella.ctg73205.p1  ORF type:complete len:123 (+),score=15.91 Plantae.Rhodophyta-Rhodochaete_pulchella.ctg73205:554-922(+)
MRLGRITYDKNNARNRRKRVTVVPYDKGQNMKEFTTAMQEEINSFKKNNCFEVVDSKTFTAQDYVIMTKCLCIKKYQDGTQRYKARLCARGFQDKFKHEATSDAPAVSRIGVKLVLQHLVER